MMRAVEPDDNCTSYDAKGGGSLGHGAASRRWGSSIAECMLGPRASVSLDEDQRK